MVSRVYGKTAFKIINVVNINKTPKNIYVIGNHHNSKQMHHNHLHSQIWKVHISYTMILAFTFFLPTPKQLPSLRQG
jgi:hypothetical protein